MPAVGERAPKGVHSEAWDQAIAHAGPVVISVHGTFDDAARDQGERWWQQGSAFGEVVGQGLNDRGIHAYMLPFHWSGLNSDFDRGRAAQALRRVMAGLTRSGQTYALVGHSHAGNVIHSALKYYWPILDGKQRSSMPAAIVTLGAPFLKRSRNMLNQMVLIANIVAFLYTLPFAAMLLLAAPSIFGLFGDPALDNIGVVPERLIVGIALPVSIATTYVSWRYGIRYLVSGEIYRREKAQIGARWLVLRSPFDEVLSALPRFVAGKYRVITDAAARRAAVRMIQSVAVGVLAALVAIFITFAIRYINSANSVYGAYNIVVKYTIPLFYFVFASNIYILIYFIALLASPILGGLYGFLLNQTVRTALRDSALGEDHDFRLSNVLPTPPDLEVIDHVVNTPEMGGVTAERRHKASAAIMDFVIGTQSARALATDPTEIWRDLNAALFHNAYFDEPEVIQATIAHLAAGLSVHAESMEAAPVGELSD